MQLLARRAVKSIVSSCSLWWTGGSANQPRPAVPVLVLLLALALALALVVRWLQRQVVLWREYHSRRLLFAACVPSLRRKHRASRSQRASVDGLLVLLVLLTFGLHYSCGWQYNATRS